MAEKQRRIPTPTQLENLQKGREILAAKRAGRAAAPAVEEESVLITTTPPAKVRAPRKRRAKEEINIKEELDKIKGELDRVSKAIK